MFTANMYINTLTKFDYILFFLSLCIPFSISMYFGCYKNKYRNGKEYLFGKKNLSSWSVGLSLYSGTVSALDIVGTTSEVYVFGTQFLMVAIGLLLATVLVTYLVLPVFVGNLELETPYEYFQLRFDKKVRIFMSSLSALNTILYMSVVLYAATVPLSEVTNISVPVCTTIVGSICIFYTLIGGFVGVIWTDVIQGTLMTCSLMFVMILGVNDAGGISKVWSIAEKGQRIQFFNFDPNPFVRLSFWSTIIGMAILCTGYLGCSPTGLQRFMAVNTERGAKISVAIGNMGYAVQLLMSGIIGLAIYVKYLDCDPITSNQIDTASQLMPLFINNIAGHIPGFIGFFTAGLLSAGLSTISADININSGIVCYDFLSNFKIIKRNLKDIFIMKTAVLVFGIIIMILAPLMAQSEHIYQVAISFASLCYGPIIGVTILGTSIPVANALGAFCGMISSIILIGGLTIASFNLDLASEYILPLSTENCTIYNNVTDIFTTTAAAVAEGSDVETSEPFILLRLSYMYYTAAGTIITILVALIISYISGKNDVHKMNPDLIIPALRPKNKDINMITIQNYDDKNHVFL